MRDVESAEMLDIIRSNIVIDFGALMYGHGDVKLNSIGYYLADDNNLSFASFYAANVDVFNAKLSELIDMLS